MIDGCLKNGLTAEQLLTDLVWTVMERVQSDFRSDVLSVTQLNLATRLNRSIADALGAKLEPASANGRRVLLFCGNAEPEELGGQITADLFEAAGYEVKFAGGGVPDDAGAADGGSQDPHPQAAAPDAASRPGGGADRAASDGRPRPSRGGLIGRPFEPEHLRTQSRPGAPNTRAPGRSRCGPESRCQFRARAWV